MNEVAAGQVRGPAIGLIVTAGVGGLIQLVSLVANVLGTGLGAMGGQEGMPQMFSGGIGILTSLIGLVMAGFIIYAAQQMMKLTNYNMSLAGAIVAMIPCISPCCLLGLPIGIWAVVILMKPEIKSTFVG